MKEIRYAITVSIEGKRVNVFKNERTYKSELVAEKRAAWFSIRMDGVKVEEISTYEGGSFPQNDGVWIRLPKSKKKREILLLINDEWVLYSIGGVKV